MILDKLLRLKDTDVGSPAANGGATETGWETLVRDGTTGQVVVQVDKMPAGGLPVVVLAKAGSKSGNDTGTLTVTIEATDSDALNTGWGTVATFPTQSAADLAAKLMVRRVATQKKYLRSVITLAGTAGTISRVYKIFVGTGEIEIG